MATRRALISVHDKAGLVPFAQGLLELGFELLSTGGTAKALRQAGLQVTDVEAVTGFPEMLGGRVKTLHPAIHGPILARRDDPSDQQTLQQHGLTPIELIVVNLYPFEKARDDGARGRALLEWIDIGGTALVRAGAKNHLDVTVVTDPATYGQVLEALRAGGTALTLLRRDLAAAAFGLTARYDALIGATLAGQGEVASGAPAAAEPSFPSLLVRRFGKVQDLRYGENKHQRAAYYRDLDVPRRGLVASRQLQGKELSYNNLLDLSDALALVAEFDEPAVAVIKHTNPCGVAVGPDLLAASERAFAADPKAAFGCVVGLNRPLTEAVAASYADRFIEAVIAPAYEEAARVLLRKKKNLRLLELPSIGRDRNSVEVRAIVGGLLVQTSDDHQLQPSDLRIVTTTAPTAAQLQDLHFAWKVCKHVKSNAIVLASGGATVGIGAGQMSRVDSVQIAIAKAAQVQGGVAGPVMASDAFFPFRDGIDAAAAGGVRAVLQPGGSIRDEEVIASADEHGMAMLFGGVRAFRH